MIAFDFEGRTRSKVTDDDGSHWDDMLDNTTTSSRLTRERFGMNTSGSVRDLENVSGVRSESVANADDVQAQYYNAQARAEVRMLALEKRVETLQTAVEDKFDGLADRINEVMLLLENNNRTGKGTRRQRASALP